MGQQSSSPHNQVAHAQQHDKQIDPNFVKFVRKAFQDVAVDGKFKQHKFQEALRILENFNIIRLRDTPLGSRFFNIIDPHHKGEIPLDNFLDIVSLLVKDKEKRISFTFKIYDKSGKGVVTRNDFTETMGESWLSSFRILGEQLTPLYQDVNLSTLNAFAQNNLPGVIQQANATFNKYDFKQTGSLDHQAFRQFVMSDTCNEVTAQYEKLVVRVPLTLLNFYQRQ